MDTSNHSRGQALDEASPGTVNSSEDGVNRDTLSLAVITGIVLVKILCCAGLLLLSTGGLGVLGAALRNPYIIGVAAITATAGIGLALRRHCKPHHLLPPCSAQRENSKT